MQNEKCLNILNDLSKVLHQKGINQIQFYIEHSKETVINVYNAETEKQTLSDDLLLFAEGNYNGLQAYGYIENWDESFFDEFANNMIEIASFNKEAFQPKKLLKNEQSNLEKEEFIFPDSKKIIDDLIKAEKHGLSLDNRIKQLNFCECSCIKKDIIIINDDGIKLEDSIGYVYGEISVIAQDKTEIQTSSKYQISKNASLINFNKIAEQAVKKVVSLLNATSIKSGNYPIILNGEVFAQMLSCYTPVFCADSIQKGMSLLKGKIGHIVASENFTLTEDPRHPMGIANRIIDDEGIETKKKYLIKDGVLEQILYNSETARKENIPSTGNGFKPSYKEKPSIRPTNLIVEPGKFTLNEIISSLKEGIIISDIDGLHAGINAVSGDFSLISKGHLIVDGKISKSLNQITIAGNFFELLKSVDRIGNDLQIAQNGSSFILAPSVQISVLTVSGEDESSK